MRACVCHDINVGNQTSETLMTTDVQRQTTTSFDRAFQNLFSLVTEVTALYRQRQAVDGPGLDDVPSPQSTEENLQAYKACFDSTGPEVHVDTVLELYAKVRSSLLRGYQCDSWLRDKSAVLYYGVSVREAGNRVVNLNAVFLMLECLKRADSQSRSQAAILRIKFANNLYTIFMTALRYVKLVEGETNVRGVTPPAALEADVTTLEGLQSEILSDLPKPTAAPPQPGQGPANPLSGLASLFPGGLTDVMGSLLHTLPGITRTVTDTISRTTGTTISESDQHMIDSTMSNITGLMSNPDGMRSMLADLANGPDGMSRFVERLLTPAATQSSALPSPGGPALD